MKIEAQYNPNITENKWYTYWQTHRFFHSEPNEKPAYTVVMPPPNVTGVLHMGHMLNNTLQDVLVRHARMNGYNACWIPGTDHASIATEAKVVERLKKQGISKHDLNREAFLRHAWAWTEEHGGIILEQIKKIGASCDWERTKFTLDEEMSKAVIRSFVDLYEKGLIYRGYRMVNWDPEAQTTLSDEEVIYEEKQGNLYYLKYFIENNASEYLTIATTRPETILGDTAICVNPNDKRYQSFIGKNVYVPIVNRLIPVIADEYVDITFGTGCLKVTPAHDQNDKLLGDKYQLDFISIFNPDGTLNQNGLHYTGKDRFEVRKAITQELQTKELVVKIEPHLHKVGLSERTKAVIEPRLSVQWFLKMDHFAKEALEVVLNGKIKFYPERYINIYKHWLMNIHDWNISRQLWWGHRIPAYYYGTEMMDFVVAETIEKALELARIKTQNANLKITDLRQDEDALDTWFSSWLWPISVFDGINNPNNATIQYYYPTADLVTAPDIIFFWVARMIMAGNEYQREIPYKNVYFTGIVRDKQRRKMSKSLGNSPDPIALIEQYGADGVRAGLMLSATAGNDLLFDEELCAQGRNFTNKLWNAFRLIKNWTINPAQTQAEYAKQAIQWFEIKLHKTRKDLNEDFSKFRLSDAMMRLYKLIWDDFCAIYLELIKPPFGEPIDPKTYQETEKFLEYLLQLLHPFMPFITEEIWQHIKERAPKEALIISQWKTPGSTKDTSILNNFEEILEIISTIRNLRKEKNIPYKEKLNWIVPTLAHTPLNTCVEKLTHTQAIISDEKPPQSFLFSVKNIEYAIPLNNFIDTATEKIKLEEELTYLKGFLQSIEKKLHNKKFMDSAPKQIIENEQKKQADTLKKIEIIQKSITNL